MNCSKNEFNHTKCTLKPGPKGEPGDTGAAGPKVTLDSRDQKDLLVRKEQKQN